MNVTRYAVKVFTNAAIVRQFAVSNGASGHCPAVTSDIAASAVPVVAKKPPGPIKTLLKQRSKCISVVYFSNRFC
ncbi:MAG: hypothetical protein AAGC71_10615, partial [Pseudomonadota bacterium]